MLKFDKWIVFWHNESASTLVRNSLYLAQSADFLMLEYGWW